MDKVTIVTHSSKFHVDDVFAVATLQLVLEKEGKTFTVVRSRDMEIISKGDYVVDVGGIYDPETNYFDHHQEGGAGGRENGIFYSSFGLVWKKFGEGLCGSKELADKIDQKLVQPIDAHDNGITYFETHIPNLYPYDIKSVLSAFRPTWKEEADYDGIFNKLVPWAKILLEREIKLVNDFKELEVSIEEAYNKAEDKRLIMIENGASGASEALSKFPEPLFLIYPPKASYTTWSLVTVDTSIPYVSRKDLPLSWAGKMDKDLEEVTGVPGAVFCHNKRFIAVAKTKEAILAMAQIALES